MTKATRVTPYEPLKVSSFFPYEREKPHKKDGRAVVVLVRLRVEWDLLVQSPGVDDSK